jgi:hypothetical protein
MRKYVGLVFLVLLAAALFAGAAFAQGDDIIIPGGPRSDMAALYRDFGEWQAPVMSLAPFDAVSGAPYWLDVAHYEIHYGGMFHAEHTVAVVGNNAAVDMLFRTGDVADHTIFEVAVGGQSTVQLWESPTISVTGTAVPSWNMNREITRTANTLIYHTPTITATGAITLVNRIIPAGATAQTRVGGQSSKGVEWVLAPETDYLLRITNTSGGNIPISVVWEWYEGDY